MTTGNLSGRTAAGHTAGSGLTLRDRLLSRLVTGPLARGAAFALELAALIWRMLRGRLPE